MPAIVGLSLRPLMEFFRLMPKILLLGYLGVEAFAIGIYWSANCLDRLMGRTQDGPPISRAQYSRAIRDLRRTSIRRALTIGGLVGLSALLFVMLLALVGVVDLMLYGVTVLLIVMICTAAIVGPPVIAAYLLQRSEMMRRLRAE